MGSRATGGAAAGHAASYYRRMTTAHNESKTQGPLRVGLIASGDRIAPLRAAVDACVLVQPLGQAGMPQAAGLRDVAWYDDPRTLLSQATLEAVLLATSTRAAVELAGLAAERGLHIWRVPPLARNFTEAAEVVTRAKRLPTIYRVASWWEYVTDHVWNELHWPAEFKPRFSELLVSAPGPAPNDWPAQPAETAGGALATAGYDLLEALVAARGLPDSVAAVKDRFRILPSGGLREVEDVAAAILHFPGGGGAVVRAAWDLLPVAQVLRHDGARLTVTLTNEEVALVDAQGAAADRRPLPGDFLASELLRFAEAVRGQARDRAAAPLDRHLAVSALLEAIYLSARTGDPESPTKFYRVQGWPEPQT